MVCSKELLLLACLFLFGGLRLTSTTTTTTFVAAMSIANQDLERYFGTANATRVWAITDDKFTDKFHYAFLNYTTASQGEISYLDEKGRYGEGKALNVTGKLVHISNAENPKDDYACTGNILGTSGEPLPAIGAIWIALVQRGRCTFEEKVKNVYNQGAKAVIVYNDKEVMNLEKMQIKGIDRDITAVITYQDIGQEMARLVDQGHEMNATITGGRQGARPANTLNRTSVLFVSISFIVLMIISLVWLIFYYIQRFRYLQNKDQQSRHLCSVTKKAIMKIPTKTGKSSDEKDADSDCCAICIEAYKASDCIRVLPCKHEFHKNCIDPWLIEHRTCPMCKLDVLKFYGYVVGDQVNATPSPNNAVPPVDDNNVPVIVVPVATRASLARAPYAQLQALPPPPPATTTNMHLQFPASSSRNSRTSSSSGHNNESSNNRYNNHDHLVQSSTTSTTPANGGCVRRNSAPQVLQMSTASRQVTDV